MIASQALTIPTTYTIAPLEAQVRILQEMSCLSLDACIEQWIQASFNHAQSAKTERAYRTTIQEFRATLHVEGLDLDSDPGRLAPKVEDFCSFSKRGQPVAAATFNQRRAILSSFYRYGMLYEVIAVNPTGRIRARKGPKNAAHAITEERIKQALASIDTCTLVGKRDRALLAVALTTGRRVSELAGLQLGHLQWRGLQTHITWVRCKGNEQADNLLNAKTTAILYSYLQAIYGDIERATRADPQAPIWLSFSRNGSRGMAIGSRAIQRLCKKRLGTSKAHALRHTWAVTMHHQGAKLTEISKGLGHKNLKTTSDYMDEQLGYENPYASKLEDAYGL